MEHKHALLFFALDRYEPHCRARHRFANRFGVSGVVLLALYVGLDVGRRHQSNFVANRLQLTGPVVACGACLDPHQASGQLREKP